MRATLPFLLITSLFALQGCIIYDHDCPGCDDDWGSDFPGREDGCDNSPDCQGDADTAIEGDEDLSWSYTLTPSEAEAGETFIASLRGEGEDIPPYDEIVSVDFYGTPEVGAITSDAREHEYLLTIDIADDSVSGDVHLLVELVDGTAVWVESALIVYEAGSGHDAGSSDDGSYDPCE